MLGPLFRAVDISRVAYSVVSLVVFPSSETHVVMSLYFSSAVDIAVLTMGENPKEAQDAPSDNVPRGAMSDDKLKVSRPCFLSSQLVHTAVYPHRAPVCWVSWSRDPSRPPSPATWCRRGSILSVSLCSRGRR